MSFETQFWLIPALLSALLWTIVSIFDKFSVHSIFTRASQGLIVSGIFSGFALLAVSYEIPDIKVFLLMFFAGILLQLSQFFYFMSMQDEEVGDLTAYGSAYPFLVALFTIPLGKIIRPIHWIGIVTIMTGVISLRWKKSRSNLIRTSRDIFGYVFFLALSSVVVDEALELAPFRQAILPYCLGLLVAGFSPLFIKKERDEFIKVFHLINKKIWLFGFIEIINVVALLLEIYAIKIGHPALVNAVASTEPVFVLIFSQVLAGVGALKIYFQKTSKLHHKIVIFILIAIGLGLISIP